MINAQINILRFLSRPAIACLLAVSVIGAGATIARPGAPGRSTSRGRARTPSRNT